MSGSLGQGGKPPSDAQHGARRHPREAHARRCEELHRMISAALAARLRHEVAASDEVYTLLTTLLDLREG